MTMTTTKKTKRVIAKLRAAIGTFLIGVALFAFAPTSLAARPSPVQQHVKDYALIFGTVWDKNGRPVYGTKVKMRRADHKKAEWEFISDHLGEFAQRVPVGTADYIIWADTKLPKGAKPVETKVHIENNERVDVGLHLTE
jgi:hypothetical protein